MNQDNHDKRLVRYLLVFMAVWLVLLTAIPSVFYTVLPLDTIETIMWSHPFSMGNAKHPPLAAWLAGLFTVVFAHTDFAMYLLSQVMLIIGFIYVYRLGKEFFSTGKAVFCTVSGESATGSPPAAMRGGRRATTRVAPTSKSHISCVYGSFSHDHH